MTPKLREHYKINFNSKDHEFEQKKNLNMLQCHKTNIFPVNFI